MQGELWQSECFEVLGIEVLSNSIPTIVMSGDIKVLPIYAIFLERGCACPFTMVVGMERVDATGGASPLPYEKWVG